MFLCHCMQNEVWPNKVKAIYRHVFSSHSYFITQFFHKRELPGLNFFNKIEKPDTNSHFSKLPLNLYRTASEGQLIQQFSLHLESGEKLGLLFKHRKMLDQAKGPSSPACCSHRWTRRLHQKFPANWCSELYCLQQQTWYLQTTSLQKWPFTVLSQLFVSKKEE